MDKKEQELLDKLQALKAEYHEAAPGLVASEIAEYNAKIRAANDAYIGYLVAGCEPCEMCGNFPHGIHQPNHYEIGCLTCRQPIDPDNPEAGDTALRVRGFTRLQAVNGWNTQDWWIK